MAPLQSPHRVAICLACGPSLTQADVDACRGQGFVIAINDAVRLAPWADMLLGGDLKWWKWHGWVPGFHGIRVSGSKSACEADPTIRQIVMTDLEGVDWTPWQASSGGNSGYVAIQLAAQQLGIERILLLGYDMQPSSDGAHHYHGNHPDGSHPNYERCRQRFHTMVEPLRARGIEVINCSPTTALTAFPCLPLAESLSQPFSSFIKPNVSTPIGR